MVNRAVGCCGLSSRRVKLFWQTIISIYFKPRRGTQAVIRENLSGDLNVCTHQAGKNVLNLSL